jgi:hypothetical protein
MSKKSGVISVFDQMIERNESPAFLDEYSTGIVRLFADMLAERSPSYEQLVKSFKQQIFWTFDDVTWDAAKDIYNLMKEVYYMGLNKGSYPASDKQLERPKQFYVFFNNVVKGFDDFESQSIQLELFKLLNKINANQPVTGGECGVLIKRVKDKLSSSEYEMIKTIDIKEYESIKDSVPTIEEE